MKQSIWGVAVLMAVLVMAPSVFAEQAPAMYFMPADGNGTCGEETTIDLMVNTSEVVTGVQAQINFSDSCINITGVDYTGSPWQPLAGDGWKNFGDYIRLASLNTDGVEAGVYKMATLTIECGDDACVSDLMLYDTMPRNLDVYNMVFTCVEAEAPPRDTEVVTYTVIVYEGQSTTIVINAADFGSMKRGDTGEIVNSVTLTNGGDMDATVDAAFTTNFSTVYGMISGANVIPGDAFSMGEDGAEVALTADGTTVYIGIVPANSVVNYDAILTIPSDAVSGAYSGDVEIEYR